VIEGLMPRRRELYASPKFFNLSCYELVLKDVRYMHELSPDLFILDEASASATGPRRTLPLENLFPR
jgi:hypothetical protein